MVKSIPRRNVRALIFDMDGVLVNSEPHHAKIDKKLFDRLKLDISEEEHSTYMGKTTDIIWKEIIRNHNLPYKIEELAERGRKEIITYFSSLREIELMPGILDILEKIFQKSIPLAVASSSDAETIEIILSMTGLNKYFLHKVSSRSVGQSKPAPDIFLYTADLLSVEPEECIVIEDSANGIKAAKAAGMYCIAYKSTTSENQDQSLADECIENFCQLEDILHRLMNF